MDPVSIFIYLSFILVGGTTVGVGKYIKHKRQTVPLELVPPTADPSYSQGYSDVSSDYWRIIYTELETNHGRGLSFRCGIEGLADALNFLEDRGVHLKFVFNKDIHTTPKDLELYLDGVTQFFNDLEDSKIERRVKEEQRRAKKEQEAIDREVFVESVSHLTDSLGYGILETWKHDTSQANTSDGSSTLTTLRDQSSSSPKTVMEQQTSLLGRRKVTPGHDSIVPENLNLNRHLVNKPQRSSDPFLPVPNSSWKTISVQNLTADKIITLR